MNKKAIKIRRGWKINPKTKILPSKKFYKRVLVKKEERESLKEAQTG